MVVASLATVDAGLADVDAVDRRGDNAL